MAVVFAGVGRVELRPLRVPALQPDELLIRTEVTGISVGTDRWMLQARYRDAQERYPLVYGYLRVGIVEAVGGAVPGFRPGDRVFAGLSGCRLDPEDGLGPVGGAYTSFGVVHWTDARLVPKDLDVNEAALAGLAAVSHRGVQLSGVGEDELVVVVGLGMIGQMAAQLCRARGSRVIAADLIEQRVAAAARWSADVAVNPAQDALEDVVRQERARLGNPHGYGPDGAHPSAYERMRWEQVDGGADVVIDTAGNVALIGRWVQLLRREGRLCLQAYFPDPIPVDFHPTHLRRATFVFPGGFDLSDYAEVLAQRQRGRLTIAPLITHTVPVREAREAFRLVEEASHEVLGMVLDWRSL
jgi:2-desacetyl-2-hydroxyethyl bacteriochlorophyllide A dehydrogenase